MLRKHRIVFNQANGGDGGAGAGGGGNGGGANPPGGGGPSLVTPPAAPGVGAGAGQPPPNGAGAGGAPQVTIPDNWKQALPPELQSDPSLGPIQDFNALVKSYIHAQKFMGADKIPVPSKHATDEDYRKIFHKLGLPEKLEEYKTAIEVAKDAGLDEAFVGQFLEKAHANGVLPKQAKGLIDWFVEGNKSAMEQAKQAQTATLTAELAKVKELWGEKYDQNVIAAGTLFGKFADKEDIEFFEKSGLAKHPRLIKLWGKMAENYLKEGEIPHGSGSGGGKMSPAEAQTEINKIYAAMDTHPYFLKDHPNHASAQAEMNRLSAMAVQKI